MTIGIYLFLVLILMIAYFSIWVVPPLHQGALERWSKFVKNTYGPGFHFKIPLIDKVRVQECLIQNLTIKVENVIPPEEYGELTFPVECAGQTSTLFSFLEHSDMRKELGDQFKQYLQDFVKDSINPPRSWRDALKLPGEKYLHWIVTRIEGKSFPKYEDDGTSGCDGDQHGKPGNDDFIAGHAHSADDENRIKKGAYKLEKCMTLKEREEKKSVIEKTKKLMRGDGNLLLDSIGFRLTRLNVLTPVPSPELQKLINDQAEQIQIAEKEKLALKVEEAQRTKEKYQMETIMQQVQQLKDMGINPKEALLRVLQVNGLLRDQSKETVINAIGSAGGLEETVVRIMALLKGESK